MNNTKDTQKKYRLGTVSKNILLEGSNQFNDAKLALNSNVDQDTFGKVTKHNTHDSQKVSPLPVGGHKAARNRQAYKNRHSYQKQSTKDEPHWKGQWNIHWRA